MPSRTLYGIPVSAGIAIGRAYCLNKSHFSGTARQTVDDADVPREKERLNGAFDAALQDLERILSPGARRPEGTRGHHRVPPDDAQGPQVPQTRPGSHRKHQGSTPSGPWRRAVGDLQEVFSAIADEYLRQRMQDVRLVAERILGKLVGGANGLERPSRTGPSSWPTTFPRPTPSSWT